MPSQFPPVGIPPEMLLALKTYDVAFIVVFLYLVSRLFKKKPGATTTPLSGPPSPSRFAGWSGAIIRSNDASSFYEAWAQEYGPAFVVPFAMGRKRVVLFDPQAIAHFYSKETVNYRISPVARVAIAGMIGKGLIWSDGDDHRRQRKILSPAFSPQAIKEISNVFFDSAYKAKEAWEVLFETTKDKEVVIDVQKWMNRISLDSIGIAGFSYDFQSLAGAHSPVANMFDSIGKANPGKLSILLPIFGPILPYIWNLPTARNKLIWKMSDAMGEIGSVLLQRSREEAKGAPKGADKSLVGTLVRAEMAGSSSTLTPTEVEAQMKTLIFAGYETSSISMTWILIELANYPEKQTRLRDELLQFGQDLTYDQLWSTSAAPYLDAVVKETLRLHPPLGETTRLCEMDDVVPFLDPVTTASREKVSSITIGAGQMITIPIAALNRSKLIWGEDALEYKPERWLNNEAGLPKSAKDMQGFHHILTFIDGPRTCLGKGFAVTEIKAVLSVLIRSYSFTPRDGPNTKYGLQRAVLPRPKIEGEEGGVLPLRVQRVD